MKKTILRVSIHCMKCKKKVLQAVSKLEGVSQLTVDSEKGTLTVVGDVDPVLVTKTLRKKGIFAEIISVGPPKKEEPNKCKEVLPIACNRCDLLAIGYPPVYDQGPQCTVL